ncbi:double-cubane-cluster-containing anaerobic reductase [Methanolobus chelungpuianus]|uniref:2-hydroxyglutaryl-CoA dehydratase n=1 Tax=Methanolobus chelungpuianus TaxID=502115 RepID=A0AAE3KVT6_9EURY|nr:double-cubane-cluster-containing anaerobic reductase [Methanolobus chelungpuianus]MCQ6961821.1 2-hydroxyglutaryl-CoA dehydratase [Methanolobus chelungpuianus]
MQCFKTIEYLKNSYGERISQIADQRRSGKKLVGTFCLFVPDEIIFAAGADRVILCGGKNDTVSIAEQYLPRNICPLVKSSFGSIVNNGCSGIRSCSHFSMVDMIVAENTCDSKKKMYELLGEYVPTYVIDLPQKPDTPEALKYFLSELEKFRGVMEQLTGNKVTTEGLRQEIRSSNETRRLFHRLYELRKEDPSPISGSQVLKILQKQYFLSPDKLKEYLRMLIEEVESVEPGQVRKPRIMVSGCPMPGGNTKVTDIIESRGGVIVAEESCTGTRSFWYLVDEDKDPMTALAERYIKIPCSCMSPNDRRIDNILELAREFRVDGVIHYTLQFCHGYNIEKQKVQKALKEAGIPMLSIETDYSDSDVEQIGLRVDAFMEMIS